MTKRDLTMTLGVAKGRLAYHYMPPSTPGVSHAVESLPYIVASQLIFILPMK